MGKAPRVKFSWILWVFSFAEKKQFSWSVPLIGSAVAPKQHLYYPEAAPYLNRARPQNIFRRILHLNARNLHTRKWHQLLHRFTVATLSTANHWNMYSLLVHFSAQLHVRKTDDSNCWRDRGVKDTNLCSMRSFYDKIRAFHSASYVEEVDEILAETKYWKKYYHLFIVEVYYKGSNNMLKNSWKTSKNMLSSSNHLYSIKTAFSIQ